MNSNQQPPTSIQSLPTAIDMSHEPSQAPINTTPMDNDNGDNFIVVNRNKKKAKIDRAPPPPLQVESSSSPSTSTSSINTDNSTSSTNTSSIISKPISTGKASASKVTEQNTTSKETNAWNSITNQARRYAETRYPFPPFIIKFQQNVVENLVIKELSDFFLKKYKFKLNFVGHCIKNKNELLLFVGNRESFVLLFDEQKWPLTINAFNYGKIRPTHLPPQFSIIMRNVPIGQDMKEFINDLKNEYPDVIDVHRISNKNQQPTTFVQVDINNIEVIDDLLAKKYIYLNSSRYSVTEYLAPVKVLVCTKCF
jgi:hypothetical protein